MENDNIHKMISSGNETPTAQGYLARYDPTPQHAGLEPRNPAMEAHGKDGDGFQQAVIKVLIDNEVKCTMAMPSAIHLENGTNKPTDLGVALIIMVLPGSVSATKAKDVIYELTQVLRSFQFLDIAIEMYEGEISTFHAPKTFATTGLAVNDVYNGAVPMIGTSVGPKTGGSSGTLGFYIKVQMGDKTAYYGVTCHHVLAPGTEDEAIGGDCVVTTPSSDDHNGHMARLGPTQDSLSGKGHGLFPVSGSSDTANMVLKDIGSHIVTSGMISKHPKSDARLDWGAFQLLPRVTDYGAANVSNAPPAPLLSFVGSRNFGHNDVSSGNPNVFKMGRTTGPSAGVVDGCRAWTCVYQDGALAVTSSELVILPSQLVAADPKFAYYGDSGALVYDMVKPHSLVWGGVHQTVSNNASKPFLFLDKLVFVTPLESVLGSIENTFAQMHPGEEVKVEFL